MRWISSVILVPLLLAGAAAGLRAQSPEPDPADSSHLRPITLPTVSVSPRPFSTRTFTSLARPKIGLVMSGGGARGISQVGVLKAFEEAGIHPDFIAGTSIGSIVGGLYAAGYSASRLEQVVRTIAWDDLFRLTNQGERENMLVDQKPVSDRSIFTLRLDGLRPIVPASVSNGQRLTSLLNELTLQALYHTTDFDSLRVPFRAVATDLYSGNRVILRSGSLAEALRASATIPVLFAPVLIDSLALVDGGLQANVPVDVAVDAGCDLIIAINTASPPRTREQINNPLETLDQVLNVLMEKNNTLQLTKADIVVQPDLGTRLATDFSVVDTMVALGYAAGRKAVAAIQSRICAEQCRMHAQSADTVRRYALTTNAPLTVDDELWFRRQHTTAELMVKAVALNNSDRFERMLLRPSEARAETMELSVTPRARMRAVRITGVHVLRSRDLDTVRTRWTDAPLSAGSMRGACEDVLAAYRDRGYALASIRSALFVDSSATLEINVQEGLVDSVVVEGNTRTNEVVILREFPISRGSVFRIENARAGLRNLSALNLFHQVSFDVKEHGATSTIVIRVEERSSRMLQGGLRIDNERNAQLGLEMRDANLFGTGTELSASFFGGYINRRYQLQYSTNKIFYTPLNLRTSAYYDLRDYNMFAEVAGLDAAHFQREIIGTYRRIAYGVAGTVGMYVERIGDVNGTIRIEQQSMRGLTDNGGGPVVPSEGIRVVTIGLGTTIDTQDRYPYPRRGMFFNATYSSAQAKLGSDVSFTRIAAEYRLFVSSRNEVWTFNPHLQFGYGDRTMPRTEQFRLGGQTSFSGMRENEFTGRQLFVAGLELRAMLPFKLLFDTFVSARYDLGRTWEMPDQIKFKDLRHGVGIGLGIDTPVGPADFSVGRSFLPTNASSGTAIRWGPTYLYFSIGLGM